jgi:NADH-quinone oxidoreductase subunit C
MKLFNAITPSNRHRSIHSRSIDNNISLLLKIIPFYINYILITKYKKKEITILTSNLHITKLLYIIKNNTNILLKILTDIICVDYPERKNRFELNYSLLSLKYNLRINIKTYIDEITLNDSIIKIYPSAMWSEREVWDMYGIFFKNNIDLRRILTDYGFDGFPMRKDYPLTGYNEIIYDDSHKSLVYQKINITQQFRNFDYKSAW